MVLVHVHIPRSGGTSISHWLHHAAMSGFTTGHAALYPGRVFRTDAELARAGFADTRVMTVSSHEIRAFPPQLCDRPVQYFTVLREPYSHFGSLVRYTLAHREHFRVPRSLTTPSDIARWLLDARFGELGDENAQTNHLALYQWCALTQYACNPDDYSRWRGEQHHAYWNARLDLATSALKSFLCVVLFERLALGLELLRHRSAQVGFTLPSADDVPLVNATQREADDESWMTDDSPLAAIIRERLIVDRQLYDVARALFDEQVRVSFGPDVALDGRH